MGSQAPRTSSTTGSTRQWQSSPNTSHATSGPLITARSARCNCRTPIWSAVAVVAAEARAGRLRRWTCLRPWCTGRA